jgi:hypothetical protein
MPKEKSKFGISNAHLPKGNFTTPACLGVRQATNYPVCFSNRPFRPLPRMERPRATEENLPSRLASLSPLPFILPRRHCVSMTLGGTFTGCFSNVRCKYISGYVTTNVRRDVEKFVARLKVVYKIKLLNHINLNKKKDS